MTRSNLYIILTNGEAIICVADSSSAPEQGYIVEKLLLPLLSLNDADAELALLTEHCALNELRTNATYRYEINLQTKNVAFFDEIYFFKTDIFRKGENLTRRYTAYLSSIENKTL
ncbi:penicillin-binding protein [Mucilaginibacter rubeus]|uniref:Penicillin-binding protein n=2 Tax=Mucilaginibacter rubeus TaxID=2027860 RepID=A0A364WS62_9SPHI|nr:MULTISPECIES: penicillin-binding protein [Mucilaginibacter]QEM06176.1 penicillin-binding protein [Mucilaginibacter rubeus]QEM13693.1 penicillin-binding protein [Mucilaginibacter rubeus]QEM18758.1 penicillin-binding protein [Mucilaginibacter gossypii]QTE36247.1 penicillin-binding protein [Mucilaginibacter gossypii]QTE44700.1 penicillin-binding protein [Mucilaginibacter rubeus]